MLIFYSRRNHRLRDTVWYLIDNLLFFFYTVIRHATLLIQCQAINIVSSFTIVRLLTVVTILPLYLTRQLFECSLDLLRNAPLLFTV